MTPRRHIRTKKILLHFTFTKYKGGEILKLYEFKTLKEQMESIFNQLTFCHSWWYLLYSHNANTVFSRDVYDILNLRFFSQFIHDICSLKFCIFWIQMSKTPRPAVQKNSSTWTSITVTASWHSFSATHLRCCDPAGSTWHDKGCCETLTRHRRPGQARERHGECDSLWRLGSPVRSLSPQHAAARGEVFSLLDSVSDGPDLQLLASGEWERGLMRSLASNWARGQRSFWAIHF